MRTSSLFHPNDDDVIVHSCPLVKATSCLTVPIHCVILTGDEKREQNKHFESDAKRKHTL